MTDLRDKVFNELIKRPKLFLNTVGAQVNS